MEKQTNVNIDHLASSLRQRLLQNIPPLSASCCIFKVPSKLRKHNEQLFEPNFISIVPYHRDASKFQYAEKIKLWYLDNLIARAPTRNTTLECLFTSISADVKHCFECYGDVVKLTMDEFVETLVIDGCFIIEYFRRHAGIVALATNDPLFEMRWTKKILVNDLLLLENQLPWFVLDCLFSLTKADHEKLSLDQLAQIYLVQTGLSLRTESEFFYGLENKHLLDLQRNLLISGSEKDENYCSFVSIPCVTELLQAGVVFVAGEKSNLTKITFENGKLTIPPIMIVDNAESLIRNIIAYEQFDRNLKPRIAAYAAFLDNLIDSKEDVDHLREKGIIICYLSTEDVSAFFNRLYNDVHIEGFPYTKVSEEILLHYHSRFPRWRAKLTRDSFSSPWSIISLIGAIVILILTFLQTLYTMFFN